MKKFFASIIGVFVIFSLVAFTTFKVETYKADVKESKIGWFAKKFTGQHNGYVTLKEGVLQVENGKIVGGEFTMDMTSISCEDIKDADDNAKLVKHLKSDDFFSVEKNPISKFVIKKVKYTGKKGNDDTYALTGDLTIKGITNSITFDAKTTNKGNQIAAAAKFTFDRLLWKIEYRSGKIFESIGDKMIYDDVEMTLNMVFTK